MKRFEPEEAAIIIRKLPFSKSWQNVFVTNVKKILNPETKQLEDRELTDFIYVPAPLLIRFFSSDKAFLLFRSENKNSPEWNYKFISDAFENNNRRLAVMYMERILKALHVNFVIDDSYTVYIMHDELQKLGASDIPGMKEFITTLYATRIQTQKKGSSDTWGY